MRTTFEERLCKLAINRKHTAGHRDRREVGQRQSGSGGSESDRLPLVDASLTVRVGKLKTGFFIFIRNGDEPQLK